MVTPAGQALTDGFRAAQAQVAAATVRDQLTLWQLIDLDDVDATTAGWLTQATNQVAAQHSRSVTFGTAYYRGFSQAETGRVRDLPAIRPLLDRQRLTANLLLAGPVRFKSLVKAGHPTAYAGQVAQASVAGAAWMFALDGGRDEVLGQVARDPAALGWARVGGADPCAFCLMLISRGPVYKSEQSASFHPHYRCECTPQPVFDRSDGWTDQAIDARAAWQRSQREARDAGELYRGTKRDDLNAFRRFLARQG